MTIFGLLVILALAALPPITALSQADPPISAARMNSDTVRSGQQVSIPDSTAPITSRSRLGSIDLPLATDTLGLVRPRFPTIRLIAGIGMMWSDFSGISGITKSVSSVSVPITVAIGIPLSEEPELEFVGGWGFAAGGVAGGSALTYSASILFRPDEVLPLRPILGIGGGNTTYAYDGTIMVGASHSYLLLSAGLTLVPQTLDAMLTFPLAKDLSVEFESKTYTIRPAGPTVSALLWF